jgi:virginiamycin A acetyltransferase
MPLEHPLPRGFKKGLAEAGTAFLTLPWILQHRIYAALFGPTRACMASSQRASRWPGIIGVYRRRALLKAVLARTGRGLHVSFGTVFSKATAECGDDVYIGSYCMLGDVRIGAQTLLADHISIPSGSSQHGTQRLDLPMREQAGTYRVVTVGRDCWIGSGAVILGDVGDHCIIGAGSVVTKPVPDYAIMAGNPARQIGDRRSAQAPDARPS